MNSILSLFSFLVVAAEIIISPLPATPHTPTISFGMLTNNSQILGIQQDEFISQQPTPTRSPASQKIKIAILGDSMVDTLGPSVPAVKELLEQTYPNTTVDVLNYGVGGTNIDYGIERITSDYEYLGKKIPSLASQQPDIVVIESFAYNPYSFEEGALNTHWLALAKAVDTVQSTIPKAKIIIAATIAPNSELFTQGVPELHFTASERIQKTDTIRNYLESTIRFATGEQLPLADAYTPSLDADGNGNVAFIHPGDHIHPSDEGKILFATSILQAIEEHKLIE